MNVRTFLYIVSLMMLLTGVLFGCAGQETEEVAENSRAAPVEVDGKVAVTFSMTLDETPDEVFVAGNFNSWTPHDPNYAMADRNGDGTWEITIRLAPGTYQYKFVVDNEWVLPPDTPSTIDDGFGGQNGFIEVQE